MHLVITSYSIHYTKLYDFAVVLAIYSWIILLIFLIGSAVYVVWVWLFMRKRRELDYKKFSHMSDNQSMLIQLITGMQEIKLNNYEKQKRWEWERIQARLFRVNVQNLVITSYSIHYTKLYD